MVREISKRLGRCLREADALMQGSFRTALGEPAVDPDTYPVAGAHRSAAPALVPVALKSGGVADTVRTRIFMAAALIDMRKSFDGLCAAVQEVLEQNPLDGHL
jgi:hypothetical protein